MKNNYTICYSQIDSNETKIIFPIDVPMNKRITAVIMNGLLTELYLIVLAKH
jgi:hypothetical protein